LLGVALLYFAAKKWHSRPAAGEHPERPGWMAAIDTMRTSRALGLGLVLVIVNPKNALLVIAGALAIASATDAPADQIGALLVFTAIASLAVSAPLFLWLMMGERAIGPLDRLKDSIARHHVALVAAVLAVIGVVLVLQALRDL
jgi:threonine/homoserine/homoserine lactone efflux protein